MIFDIISFNDYFNDRSKYFLVLILQIPLGNILSFGFFSSPVLSPQIEISETIAYPVIKIDSYYTWYSFVSDRIFHHNCEYIR